VSCVVEPSAGHETRDPDWYVPTRSALDITVVGGGVAGLEAARVAATRGHHVTIVEQAATVGGVAAIAGPGAPFVDWLRAENERLGVTVHTGETATVLSGHVIEATGGQPGVREYEVLDGAAVVDIVDVRRGIVTLPSDGPIVVFDPIGGPIAVALAEELGDRAILLTQDQIAGNELSRTGDLAPANVRLAQRGVRVEKRTLLRTVRPGAVDVQDRFSGERRSIECVAVVDCGFRVPADPLPHEPLATVTPVGDRVAPRTILEAVLEARRAARTL
jgi:2,4-dienoyl-CoA reductase (NADPH2)